MLRTFKGSEPQSVPLARLRHVRLLANCFCSCNASVSPLAPLAFFILLRSYLVLSDTTSYLAKFGSSHSTLPTSRIEASLRESYETLHLLSQL